MVIQFHVAMILFRDWPIWQTFVKKLVLYKKPKQGPQIKTLIQNDIFNSVMKLLRIMEKKYRTKHFLYIS
jgi:hypothetical protein